MQCSSSYTVLNYWNDNRSLKTVCRLLMALLSRYSIYKSSFHYSDVIMGAMASKTTGLTIVYSTRVYSGADQRKHQNSASLAFVRGIHRWPVNSPHKGPVTLKMVPFDDVIMLHRVWSSGNHRFHLRVPDLQTSSRDLTTWQCNGRSAPAPATGRATCLIWDQTCMFLSNFENSTSKATHWVADVDSR